ncbi:MAG: leucine-rich repeat protein [Bacilli bacterium]|nr:leucine-rich repeat protein [Bacilli bacterium]
MSKKNRRRVGIRTYNRYCPGAILSGIFAILLVGALVSFLFLPFFEFKEGSSATSFTGLDFVLLGLRKFIQNTGIEFFDAFVSKSQSFINIFSFYNGDNSLLATVCKIHEFIEMGLVGLFAIAIIVALFELIYGLLWIIRGKLSKTKKTYSLSWAIFILFGLTIGLFFTYLVLYGELIKGLGYEDVSVTFLFYSLICLGGIFACLLFLGIIYAATLRNRVVAAKKAGKSDDMSITGEPVQVVENQSQPQSVDQGQPQAASAPEFINEPPLLRSLPEDITEIGDHAYAKDLSLKEARIPSGITVLGAGAFANCHNLENVVIPKSVKEIGYNCFFDTPKLKTIAYLDNKENWKNVKRGSNWLNHSGTVVVITTDGAITVNPNH